MSFMIWFGLEYQASENVTLLKGNSRKKGMGNRGLKGKGKARQQQQKNPILDAKLLSFKFLSSFNQHNQSKPHRKSAFV